MSFYNKLMKNDISGVFKNLCLAFFHTSLCWVFLLCEKLHIILFTYDIGVIGISSLVEMQLKDV